MSEQPIDERKIAITPKFVAWFLGGVFTICGVVVGGILHLEDVIREGRVDRIEYEASMKLTNETIARGRLDIAELLGWKSRMQERYFVKPDEVGKRKNKHDQN